MMPDFDLYGDPAPCQPGQTVYKAGAGYSGPGKAMACFVGADGHWRIVVEHSIAGGQGHFYHIYGRAQLRINPANEPEHGDVGMDKP